VRLRARGLGQTVAELSGGNQQKVLVGSRLASRSRVLVLQEPTRGVDVGARLELHRLLRKLADDGTGTLLVTSDIEEAVILSDRLLVLRDGAIVHEIREPTRNSQAEALHAAGGLD
jgi:ribose transport system ATP-binding protein